MVSVCLRDGPNSTESSGATGFSRRGARPTCAGSHVEVSHALPGEDWGGMQCSLTEMHSFHSKSGRSENAVLSPSRCLGDFTNAAVGEGPIRTIHGPRGTLPYYRRCFPSHSVEGSYSPSRKTQQENPEGWPRALATNGGKQNVALGTRFRDATSGASHLGFTMVWQLLAVAILLTASPVFSATHPVPLDKNTDSAKCIECHGDKAKGKVVHSAIATGCVSCHEVRVNKDVTRVKLITTTPYGLCLTCHADKNAEEIKGVVHSPAVRNCMKCHDPHV